MKFSRKALASVLAAASLLSVTSCGGGGRTAETGNETVATTSAPSTT